jgi:hypothetical protein
MTRRDKANGRWGLTASAFLLALLSGRLAATPVRDHARFCVPQGSGWVVQNYAPLVDTRKGTVIVKAVYSGNVLSHVLVKTYNDRYELLYDYALTEGGKLAALHGYLQLWGRWLADADLSPDADGLVPVPDVEYRQHAGSGMIAAPKDGPYYVQIFQTVPVYRTAAEMPCAVLFQEAEKKNATQE